MEKKGKLRSEVFLIAFGVCLYGLLQYVGPILNAVGTAWGALSPIVLGLGIAFVLNVLLNSIEKLLCLIPVMRKCHWLKRSISLTLSVLIAIGLIGVIVLILLPRVSEVIQLITNALPGSSQMLSDRASEFLTDLNVDEAVIDSVNRYIRDITGQIAGLLRESSGQIANVVINTVVDALAALINALFSIMVAIFVLAEKETIGRFAKRFAVRFMSEDKANTVTEVSTLSYRIFSNFVRGQVLESIILGVLNFVIMLLFGMPYAGTASVVVGVTHVLPVMGAWIGGVISALLVFAASPDKVVLFLVIYVIVQQLESNIIYPYVVGNSVGLPGLLVLCAVIVGQRLMGMTGILLAVPICAVLYTLLKQRMNTPKSTKAGFFEINMKEQKPAQWPTHKDGTSTEQTEKQPAGKKKT